MARSSARGAQKAAIRKKEEARRAARARDRRRRLFGIGVAAGLTVVAVVFVLTRPAPPGVELASLGNEHLDSVTDPHPPYNSSPPSSGSHLGFLADLGEHDEAVAPELFVHNLEDGSIVLAYDCPQDCPDLVGSLRQFLDRNPARKLLLTPYSGIVDPATGRPARAAAVAWTRVLTFDGVDATTQSEIQTFIDVFEGADHHVRGIG